MLTERAKGGQPPPGRGVYGFQIAGLGEAGDGHLAAAPSGWPRLTIERVVADREACEPPGTVRVQEESAEIWLSDGEHVTVDRPSLTVRFSSPRPIAEELIVHPYLGLPASIAAHWLGRLPLHGGAFVHEGRTWALLGTKEGGKSSTLGWLHQRGHRVLSDDILVLDGTEVFAGPRCVDLRREAAGELGGSSLGSLASRERWRLRLGDTQPSEPLAGFIHLGWGERTVVDRLDLGARLPGLIEHSVIRPTSGTAVEYLDLAALPAWRFIRPRRLEDIPGAGTQLLEVLDGSRSA